MRKYRASNRVPFGSFLLLVLLGAISGAALGGIIWAIDAYAHFYLVFLFPIIAGAILGGILAWGVRVGKVRSPFIAGLVGILAALLMFAVYHGASYYITFRSDARAAYVESGGKPLSDAQFDRTLDELLADEVGDTGFVGYLRLAAREGLSISDVTPTSSSSDIDLSGDIVFGYWALEIIIAALFAAVIAARAAGQPFDEEARAWYGASALLAISAAKSRRALVNALKDGDFLEAGSLLTTQELKYPRMEVTIRRSPASGSSLMTDAFLTVNYAQRKGRSSGVRSGVVSPSELDLINRGMQQAVLQNPAVSGR